MATNPIQLTGLTFILRHVADIPAARKFYAEQLGMTLVDDTPTFVEVASPNGKGANLGLSLRTPENPGDELWWELADPDAAHAALAAQGVTIVAPPHDEPFGRAFTALDPDGQPMNFFRLNR